MRCKQIIDFNNMKYNINKILEFVPIEKLMLVVKANAYGHGYDKVVRFCYKQGVKWFAVATYEEAIQVYKLNLPINILILGPTECENFKDLEEKKIHFCVTSFFELEYINKNCPKALYHIAFDTGMGRIGFNAEDVKKVLEKYKPIGLFTHLSVADVDPDFSHKQLNKFLSIAKKYKVKYVHALNSYGTIKYEKDPIYTIRKLLVTKLNENPSKEIVFTNKLNRNAKIKMDEHLFYRMLENILENSIKYSTEKTFITYEILNHKLIISIRDEIGVIPENVIRRLHEENLSEVKTHGMGLFISKQICKLHCGKMEIKNLYPGVEVVFLFTI
ncbi:alanine racemase [uncultured Sneathia sp.]|uniref:alanine racemase n=1 Tax=uncultured Sneathia sp. TaxID=278067 RepID=UPI00258450CF|nr:alanine racemase [uncultured Sneathia sp.]